MVVAVATFGCGPDESAAGGNNGGGGSAGQGGATGGAGGSDGGAGGAGPVMPVVAFAAASSSASEADGTITVPVVLATNGPTTLSVITVPVTVLQTSTATAPDDYSESAATVTFLTGSGNGDEQSLTLTLHNDALVEGAEVVALQLGTPGGGAGLGTLTTHTVTINDSDSASVSFDVASVPEVNGPAAVNVVLTATGPGGDAVLASAVTVDVADLGTGSATAGVDYATSLPTTVTFEAGDGNNAAKSVPLDIVGDLISEPGESIHLALSNAAPPLQLGNNASVQLIIANDDLLFTATGGQSSPYFFNAHDPSTALTSTSGIGFGGLRGIEGMAFDPINNIVYMSSTADGIAAYDVATQTVSYLGGFGQGNANVLGLAFDPNTMTLYGSDTYSDTLLTIDTQTGWATPVGAPGNLGPSSMNGLAFDPNANVLYGANGGQLVVINTVIGTTSPVGNFGSGNTMDSLAFDAASGTLYGIQDLGDVAVIDTTSGLATFIGDVQGANLVAGLAYDSIGDYLLTMDTTRGRLATVDVVSFTATHQEVISLGTQADGVAHDPIGGVSYVAAGTSLFSVNPATGRRTFIGTMSISPDNLAFNPAAFVLYAEHNNTLYTVSVATAAATPIGTIYRDGTATSLNLRGLAYSHTTSTLWGCDWDELFTINTSTAQATTVGLVNGGGLEGLAVDPASNTIYGLRSPLLTDSLVTLDPLTAVATTIGVTGSGAVRGIGFDPTGGRLVGVDTERRLWVGLSPSTGLMHTLDGFGLSAHGMAYDPVNDVLYAADAMEEFLFTVDYTSGHVAGVGPIGVGVAALAYDVSSGTLYAAADNQNLLTLSTANGSTTGFVGSFGVNITAMVFDNQTGVLYGSNGSGLYTIDLLTAAATLVGSHVGFSAISGMGFDAAQDVLYGVDANADVIVTINKTTGVAQLVRATSHQDNQSMAFVE